MRKTVKQLVMEKAKKHPNQWNVKKSNFTFNQRKPTHKYAIASVDGRLFVMSKRTIKNDGFVGSGDVNLQTKSFWDWIIKREGILGCKIVKIK